MERFILHVSRKLFSFLYGIDECVRKVEAFVAYGNDFLRLFISLYRTVIVVSAHTSSRETEPRESESLNKSVFLKSRYLFFKEVSLSICAVYLRDVSVDDEAHDIFVVSVLSRLYYA